MINMTASGNLGRDPEQGETKTGKKVTNFSIGCRTGQDETTWVKCTVWGNRGDVVMQYMHKGSRVTVAGSAKLNEYTNKEGEQAKSLEMEVNDFTLPEKQADSAPAAPSAPSPRQKQSSPPAQWNTAPLIPDNDEIPF